MTQYIRFVTLDVFTSQPYSGNPLGVVFLPDPKESTLTQSQKQTIAREFNLSETIFIHAGSGEKRTIDIFTTDSELPFAGHPTIGAASWFLLHSPETGGKDVVNTLTTKSGDIPISSQAGQAVAARIAHNVRRHQARFPLGELLHLHGSLTPFFDGKDVTFPVFSIVKGMSQILVELPSLEALAAVTIAAGGEEITGKSGYLDEGWQVGHCVFYFFVRGVQDDETGASIIRTRAMVGNMEDPATGSAASGLASYLTLLEGKPGRYQYKFVQGVEMKRRSAIELEVVLEETDKIDSVVLQGAAVKVSEGSILVPQ